MADNDDKALYVVSYPPRGVDMSVAWLREKINVILVKIWQTLHALEGRDGPVAVRDSMSVAGGVAVGAGYQTSLPDSGVIVDGAVGVQTNKPKTDLHVRTRTNGFYVDSNLGPARITGRRQNGSYTAPSAVASGDEIVRFGGIGYGSNAFNTDPHAYMALVATENWTDTAKGAKWILYRTPNGTTTRTTALTLDGTTGVLVGRFSAEDATNSNAAQEVLKLWRYRADSTAPGAADFGADANWHLEGATDNTDVTSVRIRGAWDKAQGNDTTDRDSYIGLWTMLDNAITERLRITAPGSVLLAMAGALATNATDGFTYLPTSAGLPTGAATAQTGMTPVEYDTTGDRFMAYNNARWVDVGYRTIKLAGDVTSTATAFADVTALSFAVDADKDYLFEFNIIFQTAAVTTGIALAVNGPAAGNFIVGETRIYRSTTNPVDEEFRAYDTGTPTTAIDTANTNSYAHIKGTLSNGANAGTLIARLATEVAASQVTVKAGSSGWIKQI